MMNLFKYTTRMETRNRVQATQYYNLINRMREGVIVLTEWLAPEATVHFQNKKAVQVLSQAMN